MDKKTEIAEGENSGNITFQGTLDVKLDNGETITFPTLEVERLTLYHGTGTSNVEEFKDSVATTVGSGVYLTSSFDAGAGYSLLRTEHEGQKFTVYEAEIKNMKLLDLTGAESWALLGKIMAPELEKAKNRTDFPADWQQYHKDAFHRHATQALERITSGQIRGPKDILYFFGGTARRLFSKLGFDGIKALEGAEGWAEALNNIEIGNHDPYVIFDPKKVKILREVQIASHLPTAVPS